MISYITLGVGDMAAAKRFYSAILPGLGFDLSEGADGLTCTVRGRPADRTELYIKTPFDGLPASAGNGTMVAFEASAQAAVRAAHAAGLAAGGSDDGAPGFRAAYGARFYVGYLRDPQGNKIAIYSSNPDEPGRDG